jgi:aerobic carbon-monoxide dehydrogenase large subunit
LETTVMNDVAPPSAKFGVGQPVHRIEDPVLVRGRGRYTDDLHLPGEAHAAVLRSPVAHGVIRTLEVGEARAMPGVLAVHVAADIERAGYKPLVTTMLVDGRDGQPMRTVAQPALAGERVHHVGQAVAMVVAETALQARDALEAIELDIEALPAVVDAEAALRADAPVLHESLGSNLCLDFAFGDAAATEAAIRGAAHVTRLRVVNNRVVPSPLEPRAAIAEWEGERLVFHVGCHGAFGMRQSLASLIGLEPDRVRVRVHHVGGSFGMKIPVYPEYLGIVLAARELGRPVRWVEDRSEAFLADYQGRDSIYDAELALDGDGRFQAVRVKVIGNMGSHTLGACAIIPTLNIQKNTPGVYRTPLLSVESRCVVTNTVPTHAYRGAGRPEANYLMERLVDTAAAELGIDRIELRRRNMIPKDAFPFEAASGQTYDSGDFEGVLERALAAADWDGVETRRQESAARGRLRGRGIATYLEVTAGGGKEMGGIRFEADGTVSMVTGTLDYGQGHATAFAQVLGERLGIPLGRFRLIQCDSDELLVGGGSGGSRSLMVSGAALLGAADEVIEQGRQLAGHVLEAAPADIVFERGRFTIAGTDRAIGLLELAERVRGTRLPEGLPSGLDASLIHDDPPSTYPNGCHVAEVEVDPDTGVVSVVRYTVVDDFGNIVNPALAAGQVKGGVVQGIGQALVEGTVYDESGQLLTGSLMDYTLPRADLVPMLDIGFHEVPAKTNPLGVKGCGEAGVSGSCAAVINAVLDALRPEGVTTIDMPATPQRVWQAIRAARG